MLIVVLFLPQKQLLQDEGQNLLMKKVFDTFLLFFQINQSTSTLRHVFAALRLFIQKVSALADCSHTHIRTHTHVHTHTYTCAHTHTLTDFMDTECIHSTLLMLSSLSPCLSLLSRSFSSFLSLSIPPLSLSPYLLHISLSCFFSLSSSPISSLCLFPYTLSLSSSPLLSSRVKQTCVAACATRS